jgi:hypothetical protein
MYCCAVSKSNATAHNRTVYASPPGGGSGSEKPQSGYALCGVFLRHILARRKPAVCFMGRPKRRKQSERYVPFFLQFFTILLTNYFI